MALFYFFGNKSRISRLFFRYLSKYKYIIVIDEDFDCKQKIHTLTNRKETYYAEDSETHSVDAFVSAIFIRDEMI